MNNARQSTPPTAAPAPLPEIGAELRKTIPYVESIPVDNLYSIAIQMAAALWTARDRLAAVEGVLRHKNLITEEEVELYRVPTELEPERAATRDRFIRDIFRVLRDSPGGVSTTP